MPTQTQPQDTDREFDRIAQGYYDDAFNNIVANERANNNDEPAKTPDETPTAEQLADAENNPESNGIRYNANPKYRMGAKLKNFNRKRVALAGTGGAVGTKNRRRRLAFLGIGGAVAGVGIFALIMSFSTMLFPMLSANLDGRLARFTRNLLVHTDNIVKTKIALSATSDAKYAEMLRHYGANFNDDTLWAKINRLRPEKVAERLALDLEFEVEDRRIAGGLTRQKITAVSYKYPNPTPPPSTLTQRIVIPEHSFSLREKVFHPVAYIDSLIEYRRATNGIVKNFLMQGNPSWAVRVFQRLAVRSQAAAELRRALGIKTWRWSKADIDKANRGDVQDPLEEEMARSHREATTAADGHNRIPVDADAEAREAAAKTTACTENADCMRRMIENGDMVAPEARADLDARFDPDKISNVVSGVVGTASSLADISNLACKMYDASIMASGKIINANNSMAIASYASFSAATSQRIYSDTHPEDQRIHAALHGGYEQQVNGKVGPTEPGGAARSNIYKKAEGLPVDTTESFSPQASAIGSFATSPFGFLPSNIETSILAAMGDPDAMKTTGFLGFILGGRNVDFCDVATNDLVQGGIAIIELSVAFVPIVGTAIKGASTGIAKFAIWTTSKQLTKTVGRAFTLRNLAETGALYAADNIISIIAIAHAVMKMGGPFNGLATGEVYLNQVDAGAEAQGQEMVRAFGGRPLTESQYEAAEKTDEDFRLAALQSQSFTERYFARNNPQSLINRLGVASYISIRSLNFGGAISSITQTAAKLFNPPQLAGALASSLGGRTFAQDVGGEEPNSLVLREDYGITQFGWTNDELLAISTDPEYSPLVNEDELDASGRRAEIAQKYGRCFDITKPIGDLLAGNPEPGQINSIIRGDFSGSLEKLPAIVRDSNANIDPDLGICAPNNLGDSGPENDGRLTFKNEEAQLVFRYRVSLANHCAVNQLLAIDTLSTVPGCGNPAARTSTNTGRINPDGYAFPLDPTLPLANMPCEQITCHHDGTGAADLIFSGIAGQPVFAISDGEVLYSTHWQGSCYSIQFRSDIDGLNYWYGHITEPVGPGRVKAGQKIGLVDKHENDGGDNHCGFDEYGNKISGASHLHIDRARAPGLTAGILGNRDPCFVPFLNNIWAVANGKPATYSAVGCN